MKSFLPSLQAALPNSFEADLPSQAQWEFACRAGTETPYSFGKNITPEYVNYNGEHPYANGAKGQFRGRTVPVNSLPPNEWGLYEMHGNVWEWCSDDQNFLDPTKIYVDPVGGGSKRNLRGGSWSNRATFARSGFRHRNSPDYKFSDVGFRFLIRPREHVLGLQDV